MRIILLVSLLLLPTPAGATSSAPRAEDKLVLIHTLIGEAGWYKARDHAAILHVLDRRRQLPMLAPESLSLADMALRYSKFHSPYKAPNKHRAAVRSLTLETAPAWAHEAVERFYAGTLPDPCRGHALHWGSYDDYQQPSKDVRAVVDCGKTYNIFTK
jgi:hypothetical protein